MPSLGSEIKVIITDSKTFASRVEAELKKFATKAPAELQIVQGVVTFAAPEVEILVGVVDPAAEPLVAAAVSTVEADLATLSAAAKSVETASTAQQAVTNLQADLPNLLAVAKVSNSKSVSAIEGVVAKLLPEFNAIYGALKALLSPPVNTSNATAGAGSAS